MDRNDLLIHINNYIQEIRDGRISQFYRENLGVQSLQVFKVEHERMMHRLENITKNYSELGNITLQSLEKNLSDFVVFFRDVTQLSNSGFLDRRLEIISYYQSLINEFNNIWEGVAGAISNAENGDINKTKEELKDLKASIEKDKNELNSEINEIKNLRNSLTHQVEEYKTRYESINTNIELETQVNIFKEQAGKNLKDANKWLIGIILSVVLLCSALIWMYFDFDILCKAADNYKNYKEVCENCGQNVLWIDMIRAILFRLLILSSLIYGLTFCVKNYNACMHNKTNNDHRHNSFSAALHFYNTTTGDKRDEILIKVADSIFTYQKSGYYGKNAEPANPSLMQNVIEKVSDKV